MGFATACPSCGARLQGIGAEYLGKRIRCRKCGKPFLAEPAADQPAPPVVPGTVMESPPGDSAETPASPVLVGTRHEAESQQPGGDLPVDWSPGQVVAGLYEIGGLLGEGAMGAVHRVRHRAWDTDLAVKSPRPEILQQAGAAEDFEREAETWVNLGVHLNIVCCHYVRRIGGIPRVFAECVEGGSLADWISGRRIYEGGPSQALARILTVAIQVAWGLQFAHEQGLVHQDLKPANVMMTPDGTPKVTDFGLARARAMGGAGRAGGTLIVDGVGMTPEYASPEQMGGGALTRRSDMWSWGVSVLEMFAGERKWRTGSVAPEALEEHVKSGPVDAAFPVMPLNVANLLRGCFRMNPEARPHTMREVAARLAAIFEQATGAAFPLREPKAGRDTAASLNNRALSLMDLGRPEEALGLWDQALSAEAQHAESTFNRGLVLWRRARITDDVLVRDVEEASRSGASGWRDLYHLGLVHLERGDPEQALKALGAIEPAEESRREVEGALARARERLAATGDCVRRFAGSADTPDRLCLSGDGRFLAVVHSGQEVAIHLWDAAAGADVRKFETYGEGRPESIYLGHDGRLAASGGRGDRLVKVWDAATGRCLRTLAGHQDDVTSVRLSANGGWTLSASKDGTVRLWETSSGKVMRTFETPGIGANAALFTRDERGVISAGSDGNLRLWEIGTGRCTSVLPAHEGEVSCLCLSEDGERLVSCGAGELKLWDLPGLRCSKAIPLAKGCGRFAWLSRDGRYAAVAQFPMSESSFRLYEMETGRCARTFPNLGFWVEGFCVAPTGTDAYAAGHIPFGQNQPVTHFRFRPPAEAIPAPFALSHVQSSLEALAAQAAYEAEVAAARQALSGGDPLAAASRLRTARRQAGYWRGPEALALWSALYVRFARRSLAGAWPAAVLEGHGDKVTSALFLGDGTTLLTGSCDKTVRLWDTATGRCVRTFEGFEEEVHALSASADGKKAVVAGRSMFLLLDIETGERRTLEGTTDIASPCLSWDGRFVAFGSGRSGMGDKNTDFYLTDTASGNKVQIYSRHTDNVVGLALSRDARFLLTGGGGFDMSVKLWDLGKGDAVRDFSRADKNPFGAVRCVALTPGSGLAVAGYLDNRVAFWDIASGRCLGEFESGGSGSLAPSEDGRFLLAGGGLLELWALDPPALLRTFEGHGGELTSVALSPDGRYALSASADKTARLWFLDWELEENPPAPWHEGARPHLVNFLARRTPPLAEMPGAFSDDRGPVLKSLTRAGKPDVTEGGADELMADLGRAGYGWLDPAGVRAELERTAAAWKGPPPLPDARPRFLIRAAGLVEEVPPEEFEPAFAPDSPVASSPALTSHRAFLEQARDAMKGGDFSGAAGHIANARALPGFSFRPEALSGLAILSRRLGRRRLAAAWESRPFEVGTDGVFSALLSPDGRLAAGCQGMSGKLWDCGTGSCLAEVTTGGDRPVCVDLRPDGAYCIAQGTIEGTNFRVSLWDIRAGVKVRDFVGTGWSAHDGSLSPDGRLLLTADDEGAKLWEAASGRCVRELRGHQGRVNCARFSRDGAFVITGGDDKTIRLWDVASGRCGMTLEGHADGVAQVVLNPDGRTAFGVGGDVRLWELASGRLVRAYAEERYLFSSFRPSPDLRFIFTGGIRDPWGQSIKELKLWETASGKTVWTFAGYKQIPSSLAMSEDGRFLLVGLGTAQGAPMMPMLKLWELDWELE